MDHVRHSLEVLPAEVALLGAHQFGGFGHYEMSLDIDRTQDVEGAGGIDDAGGATDAQFSRERRIFGCPQSRRQAPNYGNRGYKPICHASPPGFALVA